MYRIGMLESSALFHGLLDMCKICNIDGVKLTVFTTKQIYEQADDILENMKSEIEWVVKGEDESHLRFLRRVKKICNQRIDLLNLRSIKVVSYWFFWPKCKVLLNAPDGIFYLMPARLTKNVLKALFESINPKQIKLIVRYFLVAIRTWIFVRQSVAIYTIDSAVRKWLLEHTSYNRKFYILPHTAFEGAYTPVDARIVFLVEGSIDKLRRDYMMVLCVFEKLFVKFGDKIELHFLGRPVGEYGWNVISNCKRLKQQGYNIVYYEEYVPPKLYKENYLRADIIISPLVFSKIKGPKKEIYSKTMPSGIMQDTIKHGKPVIVPDEYNIADEFKTSFLKYKNESDLENILEGLITDRAKLELVKKEAVKNSENNFSLERLQADFRKIIQECLAV